MRRILIIDDSAIVRNFHMNILKNSGYKSETASDGIEALEMALTGDYDLILCDINMTNMDGFSFLTRFRQQEKETPVIIISTQDEDNSRIQGFEAGANLYLSKPIDPKKLIYHIRMLTEESRKDNFK